MPTPTPTRLVTPAPNVGAEFIQPVYAGKVGTIGSPFKTLEEILAKEAEKATRASTETPKMARGGYIDELLQQRGSLEDLMKLLR